MSLSILKTPRKIQFTCPVQREGNVGDTEGKLSYQYAAGVFITSQASNLIRLYVCPGGKLHLYLGCGKRLAAETNYIVPFADIQTMSLRGPDLFYSNNTISERLVILTYFCWHYNFTLQVWYILFSLCLSKTSDKHDIIIQYSRLPFKSVLLLKGSTLFAKSLWYLFSYTETVTLTK